MSVTSVFVSGPQFVILHGQAEVRCVSPRRPVAEFRLADVDQSRWPSLACRVRGLEESARMGRANGVGAINSMGCDARGIEYEVAQRASLLLTGDAQETELSCRAVETLELLRNRYGFLPGSGAVREKTAAYMTELIAKLNDLFGTETTDQDQLVYFNNVIKGKLLESKVPGRQAMSNSKEQFANSPDFDLEGTDAIMSALDAHTSMSIKALIQKKCAEE